MSQLDSPISKPMNSEFKAIIAAAIYLTEHISTANFCSDRPDPGQYFYHLIQNNKQWYELAVQENYFKLCQNIKNQLLANASKRSDSFGSVPKLKLENTVQQFVVESLKGPLKEYLKENRLSTWTLPKSALTGLDNHHQTKISEHICLLDIPQQCSVDRPECALGPDMLLHKLGSMDGASIAYCIEEIFEPPQPCLLLSTSGSGKTRTVLEGLTRHWGFYFLCSHDGSGLGSSDLANMINNGLMDDPNFTVNLSSVEDLILEDHLLRNRQLARRHFLEVLLARLIIFATYLEVIFTETTNSYTEKDLKKMWLILQLKPFLGNFSDIFLHLSEILYGIGANARDLKSVANSYLKRIQTQLEKTENKVSQLAIVLDESQEAAVAYDTAFMSGSDSHSSLQHRERRPVIREIVRGWLIFKYPGNVDDISMKMIITGTGLEKITVEDAIASSIYKENIFYSTYITDGLDNREAHFSYLQEYLPRVRHWLRGRYRFTSEYVSLLIQDGFRRPHTILNEYVKAAIGCQPTDVSKAIIVTESKFIGKLPKIGYFPFDFSKLLQSNSRKHELIQDLIQYVYQYFMTSNLNPFAFTPKQIDFVHYGFARYYGQPKQVQWHNPGDMGAPTVLTQDSTPDIHISEPLIFLALALWVNRNSRKQNMFSLHYELCNKLPESNNLVMGNGLENYVAYYFATVLGTQGGCRLGDIFHFHGQTQLENVKAQLVAVNVFRQNIRHKDESNDDYTSSTILDKENFMPPNAESGDIVSVGEIISDVTGSEANVPDLSHCTSTLGRRVRKPQELLNWLLFRHCNPICFPDSNFGPDIIFVLRLLGDTPKYIWVVVQCKFRLTTQTLTRKAVQDSLNTLAPNCFYIQRNGNPYTPIGLPDLPKRTLEALTFLPNRETKLAGCYSVLRVICAFPVPVHLRRYIPDYIEEEDKGQQKSIVAEQSTTSTRAKFKLCTDPDNLGHPIATVNLKTMLKVMDRFDPQDKLSAILAENTKLSHTKEEKELPYALIDQEAKQYEDTYQQQVKTFRGMQVHRNISRKTATAPRVKKKATEKLKGYSTSMGTMQLKRQTQKMNNVEFSAGKKRKRTNSLESIDTLEQTGTSSGHRMMLRPRHIL
ncbi:hypothetical protein F5880DRAFT_1506277 [Lentinula raphanica]|nr:hypothetical protein F5880DRAFT_1506277 [Lentinula raphanica]